MIGEVEIIYNSMVEKGKNSEIRRSGQLGLIIIHAIVPH
jgi:hypothetical protein